jgi:hypothetical protein
MDVVYLVKHKEKNEELRHSLRSLTNLKHDRVWMAGHRPKWVTNVGLIPVRPQSNKNRATTMNLQAASRRKEVSDPFILFNDDFFVLHLLDEIPAYHRGPLSEWITTSGVVSGYMQGALKTLKHLRELGIEEPLSYDLHLPLVVHKKTMLKAIDHCYGIRAAHKRTVYGNLADLGGELVGDCKIRDQNTVPGADWLFTSTEDGSFANGSVGDYLRARFSEPGPYEEAGENI